jgi:hypothetical protein
LDCPREGVDSPREGVVSLREGVDLTRLPVVLLHRKKSFWGPVSRANFLLKSDQILKTCETIVTTFCPALPELTVLYGAVLDWVILVFVQKVLVVIEEAMPLHMLEVMPVDSIGAALVDHEVVVMPANPELITMVGIFNCLTILIISFSCRIVLWELMPMHMLKVV